MVDSPNKILILRLSSIGDILLTTPFIRQVKSRYPRTCIDFIVKDEFKELLAHNPHIDNLYTLDLKNDRDALAKVKKLVRQRSYDIIFDLHNNLRSNYLRMGSGAKHIRKIHKNKIIQTLLVNFKINLYKEIIPIPLRYLNVATDFKVKDDKKGLEIFWDQHIINSVNDKIQLEKTDQIICIAPGAAYFTKRWPKTHFQDLCSIISKSTGYKIIILGGKTDQDLGKYLSQNNDVYNFTGKLSLLENAFLMSQARALVTNDTGLMHLGTAVDIPVLALFGSTVEEFGFFPFRGLTKVLEQKDLLCRPCTHIGRKDCPKDHYKCMKDIDPGQTFNILLTLLNEKKSFK